MVRERNEAGSLVASVTDASCGDSRLSQDVVFRPLSRRRPMAPGRKRSTHGGLTQARLGVRFKGTPTAGARGNCSPMTIKGKVGGANSALMDDGK